MPDSRNIGDVIDQVLSVIPAGETALREALEGVRSDSRYRAPEMQRLSWEAASNALGAALGERGMTEPWVRQVFELWTGRTSL